MSGDIVPLQSVATGVEVEKAEAVEVQSLTNLWVAPFGF